MSARIHIRHGTLLDIDTISIRWTKHSVARTAVEITELQALLTSNQSS